MTAPLTSWRDGPAKQAIVDFVTSATEDGPRFVAAADRIATFDNDGTRKRAERVRARRHQAALLAAVTPFTASGGTSAAFVTDPGEQISQSTIDWVDGFVPTQIGAGNYVAHVTVGFATLEDLERVEAEPFDAFAVHPASVAIYQLGNSGAARSELKAWPSETFPAA